MRTWCAITRSCIGERSKKASLPRVGSLRWLLSHFGALSVLDLHKSGFKAPLLQTLPMPKQYFYAVRKGRIPGIYFNWDDCEAQTKGFSGPEYKKFPTAEEAKAYMKGHTTDSLTMTKPINHEGSRGQKRDFTFVSDENEWTVVYSDGACKGNGQAGSIAGVGVFWGPNDPRNIAERCPGDQTNNRAELIAITRVLETVPMNKQKLLIKTDSQYSINCFDQWLPKWQQNNFKTMHGTPVKNVAIIRYLSTLLEERGKRGQQVRLQYVKGHSGDPGNDGADAQANLGAALPPRPDLDWEDLRARASQTIEALIPTASPEGSAVRQTVIDVEARPEPELNERPPKISRSFESESSLNPTTAVPKTTKTLAKPSAPESTAVIPTRPTRSPLRPSTTARLDSVKPTDYQKSLGQAVSNFTSPSSVPPTQLQPQNSRATTPIATPPGKSALAQTAVPRAPGDRSSHFLKPNGTSKPTSFPPKSPLLVSRVAPPLVPVSVSNIDFDSYKDCLLEGEEWAKEIAEL
ncbi:Ribonuclease H [Leucoagaricus sp. SymC.cos]|nr:Ribonuclease H [Leucoagaricus sp. SymC.cos]